jgi:hypothetical protein
MTLRLVAVLFGVIVLPLAGMTVIHKYEQPQQVQADPTCTCGPDCPCGPDCQCDHKHKGCN